MLETMQNFESVMGPAARDYPMYAIAPASAAVVAGLFVWLGGLGFKRVLMAIAGAAGGAAVGYFAIVRGLLPAAVSAVVAAGIAALFERVFIALLAAITIAIIGATILVGPRIHAENAVDESEGGEETVESDESIEQPTAYLSDLGGEIRQVFSEVPRYQWVIIGLITVIVLVAGFVFRRLAAATCFSALGTLLIATGLIVLLLYTGATPLSRVGSRPLMYVGIFAGMATFGAVEQLLFCRGGLIKPVKKAEPGGDDVGGGKKRRTK